MNEPASRVLLIIGGGIAAYKTPELVRQFVRAGIGVRVILTKAGAQFVTPLSLECVSGARVHQELFDLGEESEMGHIKLSRAADLVVVAPATADMMAKAAHGHANDLATTALLATDKPVLMAPAMNVRMWHHPATQRNLAQLRADGVSFVGPASGEMACGEFGLGRLAPLEEIVQAAQGLLAQKGQAGKEPGLASSAAPNAASSNAVLGRPQQGGPLAGRHCIVTAGPTREPIDPVRFLSNHSSGKQGYAIAQALAGLGARVTLVTGPTALPDPPGLETVRVETARDMLAACQQALPADVLVAVAAVADWRPAVQADLKLKKGPQGPPPLHLTENPDILATLSAPGPTRPHLVVGFAAETNDVEAHARAKLERKKCDWVVANDVSGDVMGGDENEVLIVARSGTQKLPRASKHAIAQALALQIADALQG